MQGPEDLILDHANLNISEVSICVPGGSYHTPFLGHHPSAGLRSCNNKAGATRKGLQAVPSDPKGPKWKNTGYRRRNYDLIGPLG